MFSTYKEKNKFNLSKGQLNRHFIISIYVCCILYHVFYYEFGYNTRTRDIRFEEVKNSFVSSEIRVNLVYTRMCEFFLLFFLVMYVDEILIIKNNASMFESVIGID